MQLQLSTFHAANNRPTEIEEVLDILGILDIVHISSGVYSTEILAEPIYPLGIDLLCLI